MSIRWKISVLLGFLALVMLFQSLDRLIYLQHSARGFDGLSKRVDHRLEDIQTLSQASARLALIAGGIVETTDVSELARGKEEMLRLLDRSRDAMTSLEPPHQRSNSIGHFWDRVGMAADDLIDSQWALVEIQQQRLLLRGVLESNLQELSSSILLLKVRILGNIPFEGDRSSAEESLRLLITLTELHNRIEDLLSSDASTLAAEIDNDIARLTSRGIMTLSISPQFTDLEKLGKLLARIHGVISGADGLGETEERLRSSMNATSKANAQFDTVLFEVSANLSRFVRASEEEIREVYAVAASRAKRKVISEIVLNAGLGLGIVVAVWLVIARQIGARLAQLAGNVRRLAFGDLAPFAKDDGSDEVSEMARALEIFRQNALELRRSNEDLANFAYAASHDLRTPLRAIRDLVDWTIEDQGPSLGPAVASNLGLIRTRADRLSNLLQDLLDYARAGQTVSRISEVDLQTLVTEVGELVGRNEALTIACQQTCNIRVDPVPMRTILMNLISNSVKHSDRDAVQVDISVCEFPGGWKIVVKDDGPGIPLKYQRKVFELFQTLQSKDDVDGSGLGLAMVEKLISQMEGSIELVSNPPTERGATFILRIPEPDSSIPTNESLEGIAA